MYNNEVYFPQYRANFENNSLINWKNIIKNLDSKTYTKKSIIVNQGENVKYLYFIIEGLVEYTYINEDGVEELVEILGAENFFGLQSIFGKNPSVGSFIALQDSKIISISISELKKYINHDKNLANELLEELSKITNGLTRQIFEQRLNAEERVEETICSLAEYYKKHQKFKDNKIFIPFSQSDLARLSRTTRVTVTKVMSKLRKSNLIDTVYSGIIIYKFDEMKKL
ncbi:Crp/Fnr family transcriptional regulator [Clostridium felsineum]|uniref:Crp/Fnr family transcriptional regulator n=1 Tax=Clostridium felsineum TaxID=36839 RepID=UPI00098C10A7|nr:Crp/Fnr family transcriptional regulator [Clostridium felsineum]URZ01610.1 cAMP-activated global transcriptional regulator CRP [Clostridium felsineum]